MVTNLSSDPLRPQLTLDSSEKRWLYWIAARSALLWSAVIGTAWVLVAIAFPENSGLMNDALWWYPATFIVAFFLKRRALMAKAQAMLDSTNARMRSDVADSD